MRYDVFISYRRSGGEHTARLIRDSLVENGYNVFFDVESLRSGQFNTKLYSVIEECRDFVIVLSPNALDRCADEADWVRCEIEHALKHNKNVIPILLRDFVFPESLPASIAKLRYLNGIEANTQFFDAFVEKLRTFLSSKPHFFSNTKRIVTAVCALILTAAVALGAFALLKDSGQYPSTAYDKNIAYEVVALSGDYLANINIIAEQASDALDSAVRYLNTGENDYRSLKNNLALCKHSINNVDTDFGAVDEAIVKEITASPFKYADLKALYDEVAIFKEDWLDNIAYIEFLLSGENPISVDDKLTVIDCYRIFLDETLKIYACGTNELLLPIENEEFLNDFFNKTLVFLPQIPLNMATWQTDAQIINNLVDEAFNKYERAYDKMVGIVGDQNVAYAEQLEEFYNLCMPAEGDSAGQLWIKFTALLSIDCINDARRVAKMYFDLAKPQDEYAELYEDVVDAFINNVENGTAQYGPMVSCYDAVKNDVFEIGDIIVSFNGNRIYTLEEYTTAKKQLSGDTYTVECLRLNGNGDFEKHTLTLSKQMPLVAFNDLQF